MTPGPTCVDGRVDLLLTAAHDFGMAASRAAAPPVREGALLETSTQPKPCATTPGERPGN